MFLRPAPEVQAVAAGRRRLLVREEDVVERRREDPLSGPFVEDGLQAGDRLR